jgi:hypothetical protein
MKHGNHVEENPKAGERAKQASPNKPETNHGEGNPEAAAEFNKAEQEFVASKRGQQKIREAGNVSPGEEAELEEAERIARSPLMKSTPKAMPPKNGGR